MNDKLEHVLRLLEEIRMTVYMTDSQLEILDDAISHVESVYYAKQMVEKPVLDRAHW